MRVVCLLGLCLAAAVLAAAPRPAAAQEEDPGARVQRTLDKGLKLFGDLEYRKAIRVLGPLRAEPAVTRSQRLQALELIGLSHLILGEESLARDAFHDLLAIDPGYDLKHDDGSPKIRDFFDKVRREVVPGYDPEARAEIEHAAPEGAEAGKEVEVEATVLRGVSQTKEMILFWRQQGVLHYSEAPMRQVARARWRGRFEPPASESRYRVEYYIEARGLAGASIARIGGPETPLRLPVSPGRSDATPWYRRWYVIAGGAAVVGLGTAFFLTRGDSVGEGSLDPGHVTLSP